MDLMSEVIRNIHVGEVVANRLGHSGTRGFRFPAFALSGFHVILSGTCWLISENEEPARLEAGDVVLTSSGVTHGFSRVPCALQDLPAMTPSTPPAPRPFDFEFLCGGYRFEHGPAPRYLRSLPELMVTPLDYDRHPEMRALVDLLVADIPGTRMGAGATLRALLDLILVHALRRWHDAAGWPVTDDSAIAATLQAIHENPRRQWTVGQLSEIAGLPRTAFTRRFTSAAGQPPMRYLIGWRLASGARLLRETDATLATIARQVGYSTEFAFSGAFRREYGVSPGQFRRPREAVHAGA